MLWNAIAKETFLKGRVSVRVPVHVFTCSKGRTKPQPRGFLREMNLSQRGIFFLWKMGNTPPRIIVIFTAVWVVRYFPLDKWVLSFNHYFFSTHLNNMSCPENKIWLKDKPSSNFRIYWAFLQVFTIYNYFHNINHPKGSESNQPHLNCFLM